MIVLLAGEPPSPALDIPGARNIVVASGSENNGR